MYFEDESQLPQIPGTFEAGTINSQLYHVNEEDNHVSPLPRIPGVFETGTIGPEAVYGTGYEVVPPLPLIPGYFEGGVISENTFRAEDQKIPWMFERGRPASSLSREFVTELTESEGSGSGTSDDLIKEIPSLQHVVGSDIIEQEVGESSSPWDISDLFSNETAQSSTPTHSFQRGFSESLPIDLQQIPQRFDVSPIVGPDSTKDTSFRSFPQQVSDTGFQNIWSDSTLPTSNLYGWDQRNLQEFVQEPNPDIWGQNIFSQTSSSTEQAMWPHSLLETTQGFSTQSLQPSASFIDWTRSISGPSSSISTPQSEGSGSFYSSQEVDIYANSRSIKEDIEIMATKGFIVEPNMRSEFTGSLLQGWFGRNIVYQTDIQGQPFSDFDVGQIFAVKSIEFNLKDQMSDTKREMFETESYVLRFASHHNIVSMRYSFNMGRHTPYLGDLETYVEDNILSEQLCVSFIRQLCSGLKHLHDSYIFHCDIEPRNILLFQTNEQGITVKWCDFGMCCILNGTHPSQPNSVQSERIIECRNYDLECLAKIYQQILMFSTSSDQCSQYIQQIIDILRSGTDLNQVQPMINVFGL